ncbi:MAG: hydantoinase/oxoprolinase family protein [Phycisphaeraceae bacterium]|nr:hydantoinase/oxoprolinase family protein [Phycisphaeraceae bacterium]
MPADAVEQIRRRGFRVGVDTGGTFTDLLLADPAGRVITSCKVLSTPEDPGRAVLQGIDRLLASTGLDEMVLQQFRGRGEVIHGSTVATNALLEGKADAAAMITTAGFEDLLLLARQNRPELYALSPQRSTPPIPRPRTLGVDERLAFDGSVLTPLTQPEIDRVVRSVEAMGVASVAICLLHSYANDEHERLLADAIRTTLPGVHLTVSSELLPELREYERAATCAANAVVAPTMARYIGALDDALGKGRLRIMASGGGTLPPDAVIGRPVETVMSGPAGGVIGAWAMANAANEPRIIGFDMGGTSTDVALCDGGPTRTTETTINALPIRLPVIDIHTVGAGGGSIAWIDDGGAMRVGPQSAGADPGPACYGRQGETPCLAAVTDAHAVLGHLRAGRRLGDALVVDTDAARAAVGVIAEQLGLSLEATAEGILRVADAAMARAIQRVSVQRGHDARAYTLVAFGGAGGLHACRLAEVLGMTRVLVPVFGGLLSAYGMLAAPPRYAFSHAVLAQFDYEGEHYADPLTITGVQQALQALREQGSQALTNDGIAPSAQRLHAALDLRFAGQSYEITVPCDADAPVIDRFLDEHHQLYGYAPQGTPIELVTARLEARGPAPAITPNTLASLGVKPMVLCEQNRGADDAGGRSIQRDALAPGTVTPGPAILEEYAATTVVPRGWSVLMLEGGQILLQKEGGRDA